MCRASSDGTKLIGRLMKLDEIVRCDQYNLEYGFTKIKLRGSNETKKQLVIP